MLPPGVTPLVTQVELKLPDGVDAGGLSELVEMSAGKAYSRRAVTRSVERLFATGRFADIVVRSLPLPDGVRLTFELTPVERVVGVKVQGNRVLSRAQLLTAARLTDGSDFFADREGELRRALLQAYARRGYRHAQATVEVLSRKGLGVTLGVAVVEGAPTRVGELSVHGQAGLPVARIYDALGLHLGDVLDETRIDAGLERLRALYRKERFYRAKVQAPTLKVADSGAQLSLPVIAGPQFTFHFHGNRSFADAALRGVLHYDGVEALDASVQARMAERVANAYRYQGFMDVRVQVDETPGPSGLRTVLAFDIAEGRQFLVRSLSFKGNSAFSSEQLRRVISDTLLEKTPVPDGDVHATDDPLNLEGRTKKPPSSVLPVPAPGILFVDDAYRDAMDAMVELYRERGYLSAEVSLERTDVDEHSGAVQVTLVVTEGPQAKVQALLLRGLPSGIQMRPVRGMELSRFYRPSAVEVARVELLRALGKGGYLFSRVEARPEVSPDGTRVNVELAVEPGPKVHVGRVILRGLVHTKPALVEANLKLKSGDVLDPDALLDTQRELIVLGVFRQVGVELLEPTTAEPVKDVVIEVKERPRLSNEVSVGYFLAEGPRLIDVVSLPNFLGLGIDLSARGKVNYVGLSTLPLVSFEDASQLQGWQGVDYRGNLSLHDPRIYTLLPARVGARLDLVGEQVHRPSYRFRRLAAIAGLEWNVRRWLTLSLQYEIENDFVLAAGNVAQLLPTLTNSADFLRLRFPQGRFVLQSAGPTASLDFRDDPANPTRGMLLSLTSEVTKDLGLNSDGHHIFTLKGSANVSFYVPLARRTVFALSVRAGRIFLLDPNSETIAPKRFFLGGATTFRGFSEDGLVPEDRRAQYHRELSHCQALLVPSGCTDAAQALARGRELPSEGGTLFTLAKSELRFPLVREWDFGLFFEAGNLWLSAPGYQPGKLRYVMGGGIRYVTPIGPLALDLGLNPFPDFTINEPVYQVQFSVGLF